MQDLSEVQHFASAVRVKPLFTSFGQEALLGFEFPSVFIQLYMCTMYTGQVFFFFDLI